MRLPQEFSRDPRVRVRPAITNDFVAESSARSDRSGSRRAGVSPTWRRHEDGAPRDVGRHLRRLTSYQASPRLVVMGSSTLVDRPDDVPPAAYSGEWVPGPARGAPTGVGGISLPFRLWPAGGP